MVTRCATSSPLVVIENSCKKATNKLLDDVNAEPWLMEFGMLLFLVHKPKRFDQKSLVFFITQQPKL